MNFKRPLAVSFVLHGAFLALLLLTADWSPRKLSPALKPIEAHLIIKKKDRPKDLLPRKIKAKEPSLPEENSQKEAEVKPAKPIEPEPTPKAKPAIVDDKKALASLPKNKTKEEKKAVKPDAKYLKMLSSLSESFLKDLASEDESLEPSEAEVSYYDQIYSLIKESFVVPPHVLGPSGNNLMITIRIYLSPDGNLNKLDLEHTSGDEHFDKAVIDGTRRVNNFGQVPIFLQDVLRQRGVVVDLCPVKCKEH
jgi:outer membrane biosynthesis protein TonB